MINDTNRDQRRMILIVDSEPSIQVVLSDILEQAGFRVEMADSGEQAINKFRPEYYSVVITDVCMGAVAGFELIDKQSQASELVRNNLELVAQLQMSNDLLEQANKQYRLLNEELRIQANTDSLTEIYNRRFIDHTLLHEVNRRNRYPDPLSVVMIDIDHFKSFNDRYGHEGGDTVLKFIAITLQECSRDIDVVGRYGGEEFFIILPKTTPENALVFAERVRKTIHSKTFELGHAQCELTISAGVAGIEQDHKSADVSTLVNAADRALYQAKGAGRNRCCAGALDKRDAGAEKRT